MTIRTIAICDICKTSANIEVGTGDVATGSGIICMDCWERDCKAGVEELAKVKAENTALKDANASLYAELEETREQLRQVEADKSVAEIALDDKTDRFIPFMNERLAEARSRIVALEAELAERDSFEECYDCPYDDREPYRGARGCSENYDTGEHHVPTVYHKKVCKK